MASPSTWLLLCCSFLAVIFALLWTYVGVPKSESRLVERLLFRSGKPIIIGHRAGAEEAPENTLIAIENAYKNGAQAVELDLAFTKDGVPVLFHDEFVDRMTNGSGRLDSYLFQDLKRLNVAAKRSIVKENKKQDREIVFESIPTLDEAISVCMKLGLTVILDCKANPDLTIGALRKILKAYPNASETVLVTSFNLLLAMKARYHCPQLGVGVIWRHNYLSRDSSGRPLYGPGWTFVLEIVDELSEYIVHSSILEAFGIRAVSVHKDHVSRRYVNSLLARDIRLMAWTVNDLKEKEFFLCSLHVPIITDALLDRPVCLTDEP